MSNSRTLIMPIQKELLNELKCCFLNDGNIAIEPIYISFGLLVANNVFPLQRWKKLIVIVAKENIQAKI